MNRLAIIIICIWSTLSVKAGTPDWSAISSDFEFSMTITASFSESYPFPLGPNDKVAAFVDGVCRGTATASFIDFYQQYFYFLTVFSNQLEGETITFKFYSAQLDSVIEIEGSTIFNDGTILGNVSNPYFWGNETGVGNKQINEVKVFPNPTSGILNIDTKGSYPGEILIKSISGQVVWQFKNTFGKNTIDISNLPSGVYFLTISRNEKYYFQQIIKK